MNGDQLTLRPGGDRRRRARGDRALVPARRRQAALLHRPDVPPRAAAEGPLPPVPPGRRRSHGLPRAGRRRRADPDVPRLVGDLGLVVGEHVRLEINSLGQPDERARPPRGADRPLRSACRCARRRRPPPPARESAAPPRQQASADAAGARGGAEADGLPRRGVAGALRGVRAVLDAAGLAVPHQSAPGARHGLLQPDRLRVGRPTCSARRAPSAAAAATTRSSRSSAAAPRRRWAGAWASSACCCCSRKPGMRARCRRPTSTPSSPMRDALPIAMATLRGAARRRDRRADARGGRRRLGQHEGAVQARRRQRRALRARLRRRRAGRGAKRR